MNRLIPFLFVLLAVARPATGGWVLAGYFGASATGRASVTVTQPASSTDVRFDGVDYQGRSFDLPPYYGYRAAYFVHPQGWFGIEGEVIHMKVYAQPAQVVAGSGTLNGAGVAPAVPLGTLLQRFSISHGQNMLLVNAVARHAFGECGDYRRARLVGVARLGLGPTLPHVESTVAGASDEHYQRGALAFQAAAGIELLLWKDLHALAEYKFTRCRQSVDGAAGSHIETPLVSHHVAFGLSWHF